jgi:predicted DNA-binding transcriptional regulator AlpA
MTILPKQIETQTQVLARALGREADSGALAEALLRVLNKRQTYQTVGVSERTWDRLEAEGDIPTKTRLSQNRIGYRLCHIIEWLEARKMEKAS